MCAACVTSASNASHAGFTLGWLARLALKAVPSKSKTTRAPGRSLRRYRLPMQHDHPLDQASMAVLTGRMPAETASGAGSRLLAASQAGFSGRGVPPAAPCRCAPSRRMRVMPPITAAASLEVLQSQDIREEARLRGTRPLPSPSMLRLGLGLLRSSYAGLSSLIPCVRCAEESEG